jgi:hypothetical protein
MTDLYLSIHACGERGVLDENPVRLDQVANQPAENVVGFVHLSVPKTSSRDDFGFGG